jgi:hypothetical protein
MHNDGMVDHEGRDQQVMADHQNYQAFSSQGMHETVSFQLVWKVQMDIRFVERKNCRFPSQGTSDDGALTFTSAEFGEPYVHIERLA